MDKKTGGEMARAADPNKKREHSIPYNIALSQKKGKGALVMKTSVLSNNH